MKRQPMCPQCDRKRPKAPGRNYCRRCEADNARAVYNRPERVAARAATEERATIDWARKQWTEVGCEV